MTTNNTCKKCGCDDSFMVSPAPCPTPVACPTPQPCSEIFDAQCVRYTGTALTCGLDVVVPSNDTVAEALESIVDYFCSNGGGGTGAQGPQGIQGVAGPTGPQGIAGSAGAAGTTGATGPQGVQGIAGPIGPAGLNWQGVWSASGVYVADDAVGFGGASWFCINPTGPNVLSPDLDPTNWALLASEGATGPAGPTGASGVAGAAGATGPQGPAGSTGVQGVQGVQGIQGATGVQGPLAANALIYRRDIPSNPGGYSANSSLFSTTSQIQINKTSYIGYNGALASSNNAFVWLASISAGDTIQIVEAGTSTTFGIYTVLNTTDVGTGIVFNVAAVSGQGTALLPPTNYAISYVKSGATGPAGPAGTGNDVTLSSIGAGQSIVNDSFGPALVTKSITNGTGISVTGSATEIQITNSAPNVNQNLWATIAATTGSTTANTTTDTLTVVGAGGISTSITGDTLTITGSGGGGTNIYNSDGTITADRTINGNQKTISWVNLASEVHVITPPTSPPFLEVGALYQVDRTFLATGLGRLFQVQDQSGVNFFGVCETGQILIGDQTASTSYLLPATRGTLGQVLTTNGTGVVSWQTAGGSGSQFTHGIGEYVPSEGGVVIHRWLSSTVYGSPNDSGSIQNYIVMDTSDVSPSAQWGLFGTLVSNCDSLWNGENNTNSIMAAGAPVGSAAQLCSVSTAGGKADWYLPALDELRFMYDNRFLININGYSLFIPVAFNYYWSSTQSTDTVAWHFNFISGVAASPAIQKNQNISVRAVRKFNL